MSDLTLPPPWELYSPMSMPSYSPGHRPLAESPRRRPSGRSGAGYDGVSGGERGGFWATLTIPLDAQGQVDPAGKRSTRQIAWAGQASEAATIHDLALLWRELQSGEGLCCASRQSPTRHACMHAQANSTAFISSQEESGRACSPVVSASPSLPRSGKSGHPSTILNRTYNFGFERCAGLASAHQAAAAAAAGCCWQAPVQRACLATAWCLLWSRSAQHPKQYRASTRSKHSKHSK